MATEDVPTCCSCERPAVGRYRMENHKGDLTLDADLCATHEEALPDGAYLLVDYEGLT